MPFVHPGGVLLVKQSSGSLLPSSAVAIFGLCYWPGSPRSQRVNALASSTYEELDWNEVAVNNLELLCIEGWVSRRTNVEYTSIVLVKSVCHEGGPGEEANTRQEL